MIVVAGCSTGRTPTGTGAAPSLTTAAPAPPAVAVAPSADPVLPPLELLVTRRAEFQHRLDVALGDAVSRCAAGIGIEYSPPPPKRQDVVSPTLGLLGLRDLPRAERFGYLPVEAPVDDGDPAAALSEGERAALDEALFGSASTIEDLSVENGDGLAVGGMRLGDGCLRDFYVEFFGGQAAFETWVEADLLVDDAIERARSAAFASAEYQGLIGAWAACMRARGVDATEPFELRTREWPAPRPSALEVEVAIADVGCKEEVDFVAQALTLVRRSQEAIIETDGLGELMAVLEELYLRPPGAAVAS